MSRPKVTLGDVAREAGVSVSTASEALSGRGRMTATTRAAVRAAAEHLGYRPNALARSLRTGRTHAIGLHHLHAADNFASEYFREFVAGAMDATRKHDYDLTLLSSDPDRPRASAPQVDGVIIADPVADDLRAVELLGSRLPVIAGEQYPPGMPTSPVVAVDHRAGLSALLDHLHEVGARRPLLIAPDDRSGWGVALADTFAGWCAAHGVDGEHRPVVFGDRDLRGHHSDFLLDRLTGPTAVDAVIVSGELTAVDAYDIVRSAGHEIGRDVLLAACADARLLRMCEPPITAIGLEPRRLGRTCAEVLISHLDHGTPMPALTSLDATLTVRGSTLRSPTSPTIARRR